MTVRVGIRDLQHNASRVIERVKAGETVEVTERGQLVAVLTAPTREQRAREQLVAEGALRPGKGGLVGWEPLPAKPGTRPLSEVVTELRDEDAR